MIGFYDYTVVLTYMSLLSAGTGIVISLSAKAHPYWGIFFLMLCGLLDAFDGPVARTKKNRTQMQKAFGIQIDSLSDLVAFGVLPACIGSAVIRTQPFFASLNEEITVKSVIIKTILFSILVLYILAALIRLAYFNITEEERQRNETGRRTHFVGLPVTSAALIFPTVMILQYITDADISLLYFPVIFLTGLAFVLKFKMPKPRMRGILALIGVGAIEAVALILCVIFNEKI